MTKIQVQRLFEATQVAGTKAYQELTPFFEFFNQMLDNFTRVLRNGIGIADNLDAQIIEIQLQHGKPLAIRVTKAPIEVRIAYSSEPLAVPLFWIQSNSAANQIDVTASYAIPTNNNGVPTKAVVRLVCSFS